MPAYRVNEALTCYWLQNGIELEQPKGRKNQPDLLKTIEAIRKRPKPKFDF